MTKAPGREPKERQNSNQATRLLHTPREQRIDQLGTKEISIPHLSRSARDRRRTMRWYSVIRTGIQDPASLCYGRKGAHLASSLMPAEECEVYRKSVYCPFRPTGPSIHVPGASGKEFVHFIGCSIKEMEGGNSSWDVSRRAASHLLKKLN